MHQARRAEFDAIQALAREVDTRTSPPPADHPAAVPFLVWNPHPWEYRGPIELEAGLDYRIIWPYAGEKFHDVPMELRGPDGAVRPFQEIATEHHSIPDVPWRKRVVASVILPPLGWSVLTLGWVEGAQSAEPAGEPVAVAAPGVIENGLYRVEARIGETGVQVFHRGRSLFGDAGLSAITFEDPWGAWGGMQEEPESIDLSKVRTTWTIDAVETLESGPERAMLWVRLVGGLSRLELRCSVARDRDVVDFHARVFWNEREARLKLVLPAGEEAEFEVPGGVVRRGSLGEVPGGRWVRVHGPGGVLGFASDALYNFDCKGGALRATVVRGAGWATDILGEQTAEPWRTPADSGELRFRFLLTTDDDRLPSMAAELESPQTAAIVPAAPGPLPRSGSLARLAPEALRLLALKPAANGEGVILRVQNLSDGAVEPELAWLGRPVALGSVHPWEIATWRLTRTESGWRARRTDIAETT